MIVGLPLTISAFDVCEPYWARHSLTRTYSVGTTGHNAQTMSIRSRRLLVAPKVGTSKVTLTS